MSNAELREFCTQMIGKFKLLSDIQKEMQYETIDAKFTEWELKKLIFALNVLREEVRKYVDTVDTPQTDYEIAKAIVHKAIDNTAIAEDVYPDLRQRLHDTVENTPQTDCKDTSCPYFKNPDYSRCMKCKPQTDCGWK